MMTYILHLLVMISIYLILAFSLNLLVGYTGLLSVAQAGFYGIGAYISTLFVMKLGINFFIALPISIILAMCLSLLVSVPSIRLKGDYFILATLGFQAVIYGVLYNWVSLTRGPYGIPGIPRPNFFGIEFGNIPSYFILSGILAFLVFLIFRQMVLSPFGRTLKAIREDEMAALGLGKNITKFKIISFAISAGIAAIAGALYAGYITYIDPTSFSIYESIFILSMIIIGGTGNIKGPVVGVFLVIIVPEALRFLGLPDSIAANARQMIYGLLLVILMYFRPQGIAGEYKFE